MADYRLETPMNASRGPIDRRRFIAGAGVTALSFTIVKPRSVRGTQANSKIALGLIGCGGRGSWIADLFRKDGRYSIVAGADYFQDRVDAFGEKLQVEPSRRYTGLSGYKRLLNSKVDAIAVESAPYFHPEHAAAGVDAGVHVFLAKPIAVDVPGCRKVEESSKKAAAKKLCFLVDFQTRTDPVYQGAIKRVQEGDIGKVISGEAVYVCGPTWGTQAEFLRPNPKDPERRLRAWGLDRVLSGDVITEQNIHALDVATWILDKAPIRAVGTGGQKARDMGTCWDYFSVIFTFPDDVIVSFHSKQYGLGIDDICCRMYGTEGIIDTHYFGDVKLQTKAAADGGKVVNLYQNGAIRNIAAFAENIRNGDLSNATVPPSVRSNLTTILGRTAAYRRAEVTWDEIMKTNESLDPKLTGLKA
jgi:myo-inositol 2-dehydrogenase/D-chiro-inositol 1-dehydrogenase